MIPLELQDTLTLPELLRIAYEYGNSNASMPEGNYLTVEVEFNDWLDGSKGLISKLKADNCGTTTSQCMYCEKEIKPNEAIVICKDCCK